MIFRVVHCKEKDWLFIVQEHVRAAEYLNFRAFDIALQWVPVPLWVADFSRDAQGKHAADVSWAVAETLTVVVARAVRFFNNLLFHGKHFSRAPFPVPTVTVILHSLNVS